MSNCKKHVEGDQWVCNHCEHVWDLSDDDPPICEIENPHDVAIAKIKEKLKNE